VAALLSNGVEGGSGWGVTTKKRRQLTNLKPGYSIGSFDVSPDRRQILFDRVRQNSDIVLIDLVR
jgi:hypothetical protein